MKFATKLIPLQQKSSSTSFRFLKLGFLCLIILISLNLEGYSQTKKTQPSWWFGVGGGINFNAYNGSLGSLNRDITVSTPFERGFGVGGYFAPVIEYHHPGSMWGIMLQQGLDNRRATFTETGIEFKHHLSYYTVEPSFMIMPPKVPVYFYAGPRFGFGWSTTFTYKKVNSPDYPNKADPEAHAYLRSVKKNPVSMQLGMGYNLMVSSKTAKEQFIISPFVTYLPSLGQNIRTIESLKLNTLRAGIILKAGCVSKME